MAKAKASPAKKGGKAKAAATPEPPVRRSPRKAVQSAKKAADETEAKVTKKAAPATAKAAVKKLAGAVRKAATKKASPAPKKAAAVAKKASPAPKKAAATAKKAATTVKTAVAKSVSPAPKKSASPATEKGGATGATKSATPAAAKKTAAATTKKSPTASPKPRGRPRKDGTPAGSSPTKVTKTKATPKAKAKPATKAAGSARKKTAAAQAQDVNDSPAAGTRSRASSAGRASASSARAASRSVSPAKQAASKSASPAKRAASRSASPAKSAASRSASPAKRAASRSASPAKRAASRSTSPPKRGPGRPAKSPSPAKATASSPARNRSASPRKTSAVASTRTRSRSPVKGRQASAARGSSAGVSSRRSKSPTLLNPNFPRLGNAAFQEAMGWQPFDEDAPDAVSSDEYEGEENGQRVKGRSVRKTWQRGQKPRSPVGHPPSPQDAPDAESGDSYEDEVDGQTVKTRNVHKKWTKGPNAGATKYSQSRTTQSKTSNTGYGPLPPLGAFKIPTKAKASSATRKTATSPRKASTTQSPRKNSADARFDAKLQADDAQGRSLRAAENKAYKAAKAGKATPRFDSPGTSDADVERAVSRGIERAQTEHALREMADSREQRVREGYDGRIVDLSEAGGQQRSQSNSRGSPEPKKRGSKGKSKATDLQMGDAAPRERQPSEPGRGNTESVTNPRVIAGTGKLNPFYETMPAPEQWHRNMPPYFPFGETPYMQREMSRQINEDLARGAAGNEVASAPTSGVLNNMFNKARQLMGGGGSPRRGPPSEGPQFMGAPPFVMPKVIEGDVDRARADFERQERQVQGQIEDMHRRASPGRGRSGRSPRPIKRARRRSSSGSRGPTDHEMSGAL